MALRMTELAAELRGVQAAVRGSMGSAAGWSGSAELAFQESLTADLARFAPVVRRYDEYAAALTGYARELDYLQPRLLAARSRLGMSGDSSATSEYERCWREWDTARRRCIARLQAAGLGAAVRHHGWWSGLADGVGRLVHRSESLAGLSRLLSELGEALMVAGLVCALVCPPLAGAVWAAIAVVAVCQLAVDAARRARGEAVGWDSLGWDVAGVVPAGRAVRRVRLAVEEVAEYRTAAEASAAIDRLPVSLRSSPVVPGGLKAHEGSATFRGHTILKHVKKTREELMERFADDPNLRWSSSFPDRATAEAAIAGTLNLNNLRIARWMEGNIGTLILDADVGWDVGISVAPSGMMVTTAKLRVVLRKEPSVLGYYIKTAFPTP